MHVWDMELLIPSIQREAGLAGMDDPCKAKLKTQAQPVYGPARSRLIPMPAHA